MEDGLPLVIVQPGAVYGPYDKLYGSARAAFRDYLQEDLPMVPKRWSLSFDYAADTAIAHILAMENGDSGEEYIVASEPRTLSEVFGLAEDITGVPAPRAVPDWVFGGLAKMMRGVERITVPPEGLEAEMMEFFAGRQYLTDNTKAKRELGIEHRSLEEGLREYLEWEIEKLGIDVPKNPAPTP